MIYNPLTNYVIKKGGSSHKKLINQHILAKNNKLEEKSYKIRLDHDIWKFFPRHKVNIKYENLQMTNIGIYSITKPEQAQKISEIINHFNKKIKSANKKQLTITDATANVGGNTISFLLNGFKVNSIEIDNLTCDVLKNNLKIYKFDAKRYKIYCKNYVHLYKKLKQDIVFIDPPWGGPSYKKKVTIDLYLDGVNLVEICHQLFHEKLTKLIVLKLPKNFNYTRLFKKLTIDVFEIHKIYDGNRRCFDICLCYSAFIIKN